jgi:hypothetical protein
MVGGSTSRIHHLRCGIDPKDLALGADYAGYGQSWLPGPRSNIQNRAPGTDPRILDESLRNRRKHLPDDFAVFLPEGRRIAPCVYNLGVGLHQQKYTYRTLGGQPSLQRIVTV